MSFQLGIFRVDHFHILLNYVTQEQRVSPPSRYEYLKNAQLFAGRVKVEILSSVEVEGPCRHVEERGLQGLFSLLSGAGLPSDFSDSIIKSDLTILCN